jgi:hypothetical protein
METLPVYHHLGLQLISLPEELQFATTEVIAYRDGRGVRLMPADAETEREMRELRNAAVAGERQPNDQAKAG